ncbi:MAG: DUF1501 domain-containing protein [Pirellulaceae bacterium]
MNRKESAVDPASLGCAGYQQFRSRRHWMAQSASAFSLASSGAWSPLVQRLAAESPHPNRSAPATNIILLWMQGGPSQMETFDPHPEGDGGEQVGTIETEIPDIAISSWLPESARQLGLGTLIRSMVSKEGDHERATYNMRTGWRPDPTVVHPSIGSLVCHLLGSSTTIPAHVSILPGEWPSRGGALGAALDAFQIGDPRNPLPNLRAPTGETRQQRRLAALSDLLEPQFEKGRLADLDRMRTQHRSSMERAQEMMQSDQLAAFELAKEPAEIVAQFGDHAFGRGCLAAVRLVEAGVRSVEVELSGWDSHINNMELQKGQCQILDRALAATLQELVRRGLLEHTLLVCSGEFGRTPNLNPAGGRDHWPVGFSSFVAGAGIAARHAIGATSAKPRMEPERRLENVDRPVTVEDLHATLLTCFGIDAKEEWKTPVGRPLAWSQGRVVESMLDRSRF